MCEQTPVVYKDGDIVWVKLGSCWWPGEVQDFDKLPADWLTDFKKPPLAAVKFFDEDNYEYVKSIDRIYSYNCSRKNEFIKKGLDLLRSKHSFMKKFPDDVATAENKTNGDPNIISDPIFIQEKKPNYASLLFGSSPKTKKTSKKSTGSIRKSLAANLESPCSSPKVTTSKSITHPRFVGHDDHEVRILVQSPTRVENTFQDDSNYNCSTCGFTTSRIDVIVLHNKSHIQGVYSTPISSTRKSKKASPKRGKKVIKMAKSKTSSIMEDLALIEKGLFMSTESSEEDDSEDWDDDLLPPRKRRKVKRKPKKPIPKEDIASPSKIDIRNNLLAEWEEDSETEVDDNAITSSANIEDSDTSMNKTDDTVQSIDINNESISNLENKESNKSCFDFEEDDTEIVGTSVGRKIPRILPPSKPLISDVENDDSGLSDIISCPMESVEEKDKDDKTDVEHETKKSELNDPDVHAFQDILNVTNVPSLPEVPHSLKFEQNFHNAKTIKFPDKSSIEEESNASACETEVLQKQSSEESIDQFDIQDFKSKKNLEVLEMEVDDVVRPSVEELTETLSKQDVEVEIAPMTDLKEIAEVDAQNNSSKVELKSEAKDKLAIVNKFGSDDLNEVSGTEVQKLGTSLNKSPVKEVVVLPSKLINPKKRFVKSFEDFEQQLNNEQRKLMENETSSSEELTISPVLTKLIEVTTTNVVPKENPVVEDLEIKKSGVEFSKLKTQLKSKLESTSDSYQSEVIKVKRDRTFEKRKSREYLESRSKKPKLLFESLLHEEHSTSEDSLQEVAIVTSPIISNISKVQEAEDVKMSESKSPISNISKVQEAEDVKISESNKDVHSESNFENRSENENVILDLVTENRTAVNKDAAEAPKQSNQLDLEPSITTESSPIVKTEANDIETSSTSSIVPDDTVINKNLEIQSDTGDLSALSALAAVSELSTSLTVHSVEEDKPKAINQSLDFLESTNESCELKLTEGNLTYFTESDLVDSQVEIVNLSPVKEKCKPVTLSTFSVDFTDSEDKDVQVPKCEANKVEKSKPIEKDSILDFMKSEFQSSDSSASEDNISNILPLHSAPPVQDYGSSKLLEILSEGKEQETTSSLQRSQSGQKSSSGQRSYSKVEMSPSINKDYSKSVLKNEPKNIKFFSKSGISEKATSSTIKSGKPIILSNQIIKSTSDVETVSVQKVSSKKTNQGFDDNIDAFIIKKPIKRPVVQEEESVPNVVVKKKQPPTYRGKARILQQTIIKPTGDIVASTAKTSGVDDNMFDINSMPIVLGDQILTEDCIENMPVVLSESEPAITKINTPAITKTHSNPIKLLNKPLNSQSPPNKVLLKTYTSQKIIKSPRIYQSTPTKSLKPNSTLIARSSKPDKFIIVPPSSNSNTPTVSKYTVGKKTAIIKKSQTVLPTQSNAVARIPGGSSEPSGNKIMIVTNQQGQQSRVLLTPAQQKLIGYQTTGTKLVKSTLKGNILQKSSVKCSTNPKASNALSHTIINSMGNVVSTSNQSLILSDGQKLVPIRPQTKISKNEITKPFKKIQMPSQKVVVQESGMSKGQQKTIVIQNKLGQVIKKIQGTEDTLLEQQVAENLQAIKASGSFATSKTKQETISTSKSRPPVKRPSYMKKPSIVETPLKSTSQKIQTVSTSVTKQHKIETSMPPLTPISPKKVDKISQPLPKVEVGKLESTNESFKQEQVQPKPPNQLIIQDALGNQTTITEGQILALPSGETIDGQPQSYMLVTLDETGNLAPLNNEALLSLDPNLCLGGDLSNMVLQIDEGSVTAKTDTAKSEDQLVVKAVPHETPNIVSKESKIDQVSDVSEKVILGTKKITALDNISQDLVVENSDENVLSTFETPAEPLQPNLDGTITCNIGTDPNQQLIITGDPVSTQKFIESLTEGNQDLANLLASAEGNILIHTDDQQILINTDGNNQILLPMNADNLSVGGSESHGNPMFATQSNKNQDILAAALADTDVFQSEPSTQTKIVQSQLSPGGGLYPSGVANVLGTTLSLSSPIMTPLEVPSSNNKKIPDEESNLLITEVPKNVDLPITITDPNISQTVSQQQVASMIVNELTTGLELPLSITETGVPLTSTEMNSPSFVYSLPSLDDSVDIHQKAFSEPISMPLLTEDQQGTVNEESPSNENLELSSPNIEESVLSVPEADKEENVQSTSQSFLTIETEGLCTLGGAMCSSLSEPPPDMFDLSLVTNSNFVTESEIKDQVTETNSITVTSNVTENVMTSSIQQQSPKSSIEISSSDHINELDTYDSESRNDSTPLSSLPLNSESNSPAVNLDENSCEIPVQPQIVADLNLPVFENNETTDSTYFSSNKELNTESTLENEKKITKLD